MTDSVKGTVFLVTLIVAPISVLPVDSFASNTSAFFVRKISFLLKPSCLVPCCQTRGLIWSLMNFANVGILSAAVAT